MPSNRKNNYEYKKENKSNHEGLIKFIEPQNTLSIKIILPMPIQQSVTHRSKF